MYANARWGYEDGGELKEVKQKDGGRRENEEEYFKE